MAEAEQQSELNKTAKALFDLIDSNKNGFLTKGEMFKAMVGEHKATLEEKMGKNFLYHWTDFQALSKPDKDLSEEETAVQNSRLDVNEFTAWVKDLDVSKKCAEWFAELDQNESGEVTKNNMMTGLNGMKGKIESFSKDFFKNWDDFANASLPFDAEQKIHAKKMDVAEFTGWMKDRLKKISAA